MTPEYAVKVLFFGAAKREDVHYVKGWGEAIRLSNQKAHDFDHLIHSIRIIRIGSHPGNDFEVARWSSGDGWDFRGVR